MLDRDSLVQNMKCSLGFKPYYDQSICKFLKLVRCILGISNDFPFEIKNIKRADEIIILITSFFSFQEVQNKNFLPLSSVFPSTRLASLSSLFLESPPISHGFFGKEIFAGNRTIDLDDIRITRKERHIWRHYNRFGRVRERTVKISNYFYLNKLAKEASLFNDFDGADIRIYHNFRRRPYFVKMLGLDKFIIQTRSIQEVLCNLKRRKKFPKKVSFILLDSYRNRSEYNENTKWSEELLTIFNSIKGEDLVKMLISTNGSHESELAIPFTQGEIRYFHDRGVYLCLDNRVGLVYGNHDDCLTLLKDKLKGRADLVDPFYLKEINFFNGGEYNIKRFGNFVILPRDKYTLSYEEVPPVISGGGLTEQEMIVPLIIDWNG